MSEKSSKKIARQIAQTRSFLAESFPKCFSMRGDDKRPIAVGINQAVMAMLPEIGFRRLSLALSDYTSGPTYLRNVVEGADRIGLDGEAKGKVTAAEADHAKSRLLLFKHLPAVKPQIKDTGLPQVAETEAAVS